MKRTSDVQRSWLSPLRSLSRNVLDCLSPQSGGDFLGSSTLKQLGFVCVEQDRLCVLFCEEVSRSLALLAQHAIDSNSLNSGSCTFIAPTSSFQDIPWLMSSFQMQATAMLARQQRQLQSALYLDKLFSPVSKSDCPELCFRHQSMFHSAHVAHNSIHLLINEFVSS